MEYCSTNVMHGFFELISESFSEINASMRAGLRAQPALPVSRMPTLNGVVRAFPPTVKKGKAQVCRPVEVTPGSFETETEGPSPHSGAYDNYPSSAVTNASDLGPVSIGTSAMMGLIPPKGLRMAT
jgi:hypothetical protein